MMTADEARQFAEANFPNGPESLANQLGISVSVGPLVGCDGWVLTGPACTVIRLNAANPKPRQRFTLAHELGHLLLGVPTLVGESVYESLRSDSTEERRVNDLAAELLLPESVVRQAIPDVPVVAQQIKKLAKQARVSELMVALRVANLAPRIGLKNASVAFFLHDKLEWNWSSTLTMPIDVAHQLLAKAKESAPAAFRFHRSQTNDVIVASLIHNPYHGSATLFVQLLPEAQGNQSSLLERRHELESLLFAGDDNFRNKMQGCLSATKGRFSGKPLAEAIADYTSRYSARWTPEQAEKLKSLHGIEYVLLRLSEWCTK